MTFEETAEVRTEIAKSLGIPLDFVDFDSTDFSFNKKFSKKVRRTQRRVSRKLKRLLKKYYADAYKECRKKNGIHWWEFWK